MYLFHLFKGENQIIEEICKDNSIKKYLKGKFLGKVMSIVKIFYKGGFAKCYELTSLETKKLYAAKIIAKSTLIK